MNGMRKAGAAVHNMGARYGDGTRASVCATYVSEKMPGFVWTDAPVTCKGCLKAATR